MNSAFHGTRPERRGSWTRDPGDLICGITTNHCCETTARVAGTSATTCVVLDATSHLRPARPDGEVVRRTLARVTATNLHGEFATVTDTAAVIADR